MILSTPFAGDTAPLSMCALGRSAKGPPRVSVDLCSGRFHRNTPPGACSSNMTKTRGTLHSPCSPRSTAKTVHNAKAQMAGARAKAAGVKHTATNSKHEAGTCPLKHRPHSLGPHPPIPPRGMPPLMGGSAPIPSHVGVPPGDPVAPSTLIAAGQQTMGMLPGALLAMAPENTPQAPNPHCNPSSSSSSVVRSPAPMIQRIMPLCQPRRPH